MKSNGIVTVSMSDLVLTDVFKENSHKPKGIEACLYALGMDVSLPYEIMVCTHRNVEDVIVTCERFSGSERRDERYLDFKASVV
jgi:hypothetical protein